MTDILTNIVSGAYDFAGSAIDKFDAVTGGPHDAKFYLAASLFCGGVALIALARLGHLISKDYISKGKGDRK